MAPRRITTTIAVLTMGAAAVFGVAASAATIKGTAGDDRITGTPKRDRVYAYLGDDVVKSRGANDIVDGGGGDDTIALGHGSDRGYDGTGNDTLRGGPGPDWLEGRRGNDTMIGGAGSDEIETCFGNDVVRGGRGADLILICRGVIFGGPGRDKIYLDGNSRPDVIDCGRGIDEVVYIGEVDPQDTLVRCEDVHVCEQGACRGPGPRPSRGGMLQRLKE